MKRYSSAAVSFLAALLVAGSAAADGIDTATTLISNDKAFTTWMVGDSDSFTKAAASMRHLVHIDLPRNQEEAKVIRSINVTVGLHGAFEKPKPGVEVVVVW